MSVHVEEGGLLAYVDGELPADERELCAEHLRECLTCRRALEGVRARAARVSGALALLDRPAPVGEAWQAVSAALGAPSRPVPARARPGLLGRAALARAAGLLLLLAGGAAAAVVPGSPLRSWLFGEDDPVTALGAPEAEVAAAAVSGLFTVPVDGRLEVTLVAPAGTDVVVAWEGGRAGVTGPVGTDYDSARDGILRADAQTGPLRVEIPTTIQQASLRVNGSVVLTIQDGRAALVPPDAEGELVPGGDPLRFRAH